MDLTFKPDQFMPKSELKQGNTYIFKDGHVRVFLGASKSTGKLAFYTICRLAFYNDSWSTVKLLHEPVQIQLMHAALKQVLSARKLTPDALVQYASQPSVIACLLEHTFDTVIQRGIEDWLVNHELLDFASDAERKHISVYTNAKDLVPGMAYHTGQSAHRSSYIYLGRVAHPAAHEGWFCWFFVGASKDFVTDPVKCMLFWRNDLECTKTNKRVRPVTKREDSYLGDYCADINKLKDVLLKNFNIKLK